MKVELTRRGAIPHAKARDAATNLYMPCADPSWRTWAYEEAVARGGPPLEGPVLAVFTPTAATKAKLGNIDASWHAASLVLAGLVAGGLLTAIRGEVVELTLRQPRVTGDDGMIVVLADHHEGF